MATILLFIHVCYSVPRSNIRLLPVISDLILYLNLCWKINTVTFLALKCIEESPWHQLLPAVWIQKILDVPRLMLFSHFQGQLNILLNVVARFTAPSSTRFKRLIKYYQINWYSGLQCAVVWLKSQTACFGSNPPSQFSLVLNGMTIPLTEKIEYLGVYINSNQFHRPSHNSQKMFWKF